MHIHNSVDQRILVQHQLTPGNSLLQLTHFIHIDTVVAGHISKALLQRAAGTTDMSSINLAELGQSVIEQCDISDVEAIANNMNSLLPMLQGLQQQGRL